jgi:uncharacterized protein YfaS (alpha-2-macroglobulin family)
MRTISLNRIAILTAIILSSALHALSMPPVTMIGETTLNPGSTLEFRFTQPMVKPVQLGAAATSPVKFTPELQGAFTWLSPQSGVFVPTGPLPLGGKWSMQSNPDWKLPNGKPWDAFPGVVTTPGFGTTVIRSGVWDGSQVAPMVSTQIAFNAPVSLESAKAGFVYSNAAGDQIPATVRLATTDDYFQVPTEFDEWMQRWAALQNPSLGVSADEDENSNRTETRTFTARLIVTPAQPLPPGVGWKLTAPAGLASADGKMQTTAAIDVALGTVEPLKLVSVSPANLVNSGTAVTFSFNRLLAPDITADSAKQFFSIEPAVEPSSISVDWQDLTVRGDFEINRDYTLVIDDGVIAADGLSFDGERRVTFRFAPVLPRLYLPEITGEQLRFGRRTFPIRYINVAAVHLTAKRIKPADIPEALKAFATYQKTEWDENNPDEVYQPVSMESLESEVVFDGPLALGTPVLDEAGTQDIQWSEVLGDNQPGSIFLTFTGDPMTGLHPSKPGAQALVQITDLAILWKSDSAGLQFQVFSMQTGRPVDSALAVLQDSTGAVISEVKTDADGKGKLPFDREPAWLLVTAGDDAHAIRMGPEARQLPVWAFGIPTDYRSWEATASSGNRIRGLLFTDRPLYQPGETIHVKGIVRELSDSGITQASTLAGQVILVGPRGDLLETKKITTDANGAFSLAFKATATQRGEYRIAFRPGSERFEWWQSNINTSFLIADYQPNAFEVSVNAPEIIPAGESLPEIRVSGKYFFGSPITNAKVQWLLQSRRSLFEPEGFGAFAFLSGDFEASPPRMQRGEGAMTDAGGFTIPIAALPVEAFPSTNRLTVEVTDINQQTVSTTAEFVKDSSDFYLGIATPESRVLKAGESRDVRVVAVRPDGTPLQSPVEYTANMFYSRNNVVRVKGAGGAISFQTTTVREPAGKLSGRTVTPQKSGDQWTLPEDAGPLTFPIEKAGEYVLEVRATDSGGREVVSTSNFYVAGPGETVWDYRNPSQIDLIPDKPEYQSGETARVLVKNPIPGDATVSIEQGDRILRSFQVELEGNAPVIEIPIEKSDSPNVFVSLVVVRSADASKRQFPAPEFRYGVCNLRVINPSDELSVRIDPERTDWQPGENALTKITVQDPDGKPVRDASVTFFAVDDGILALTGYSRPDPLSVFRAVIPLGVRTGLTLDSLLPENPEDLLFSNKGYLIGGGGFGGPGSKFRKDFPGTICWMPDLRTGADGTVAAAFVTPDALTRYRLVAVASSGVTRFGSSESAITISKPLMLLSGVGAFANVGDTLVARVVIQNQTGTNGAVRFQFQPPEGVETLSPVPAEVIVEAGRPVTVDIPIRFTRVGQARLEWSIELTKDATTWTDALAVDLTVGSPMVRLRETYLPTVDRKSTNLMDGINPQLKEGTGTVRIAIADTRLVGLGDGARYLINYPFGCAEQTVSSMIPWLVQGLAPLLPEMDFSETGLRQKLTPALTRIGSLQLPSGGIAFWPGGREPSLFASAWTAVALSKISASGITDVSARQSALVRFLAESLRGTLQKSNPQAVIDRALTLYALALAGKAEPAYHEELLLMGDTLPDEARCLLALAMTLAGGDAANEAARELLSSSAAAPAIFTAFGNPSREAAIRLLATTTLTPTAKDIPAMVAELMQLRTNGEWGNTQANAWALMALESYFENVESKSGTTSKSDKPVKGTIIQGTATTPFSITKLSPVATHVVDFSDTSTGRTLEISNPQAASLFAQTTFDIIPRLGEQPRQDRGFSVAREYQKFAPDGTLSPAENLKTGDRVLVTLRVESTRPGLFVAVDDPLPSVLEAINPDFTSRETGEPAISSAPVDFREMLSDRVRFFTDRLPAGVVTYQYLARVRNAGESTAPPTKVEEMYRPDRFGLGTTQRITATAEK